MISLQALLLLFVSLFQVSHAACTGTQTWYFRIDNKSTLVNYDVHTVVNNYIAERGLKVASLSSECKVRGEVDGKNTCQVELGSFVIHNTCIGTNVAGFKGYRGARLSVKNSPYTAQL